ncbi:MAG: PP2C family protein-serine/threonine phosphatase [Deltaproteobacteria bacterium]|jgi:sigma-B regulation protein RsbU (phosphoserine phosphatase)|nr:PP2C family protein-serine/threonine phosphatase [Deltaproteobacteria bacterium]
MGFRLKTSVLIVAAVFLSVVPFSLYSLEEFTSTGVERERRDFRVAAAVLAEEIRASNYSFLAEEVLDIVGRKEALRKVSFLYASYLDVLEEGGGGPPELEPTSESLRARLSELGVEAGMIRLDAGGDETVSSLPESWTDVTDVLGRNLAYLALEDEQSSEGRFYLFNSGTPGSAGARTLLGFMCPSGDRRRIYAFLEDVTVEAVRSGRAAESVLGQLRYRLSELPLSERSLAAVFGPDGTPLLTYGGPREGEEGDSDLWRLPPEAMEKARGRRFLEENIAFPGVRGPVIMRVEHFRPLDWYITLATPHAALSAPSRALAWKLAFAAGVAVVLGVVFALVSAKVLARGLLSLERRASEAEGLDLADPSSADFFRADPLAERRDEVGSLAGAVDRLGLSLVTNIQEAIAAGKAQERVLGELTAAREIQAGMLPLPREAPKTPGFDAAAMLHPAKEVGGDLYDFFTAPCGRRCLAIGDVSDKGVPAALFMSMVVTLVRGTIQSGLQPEAALALLNEQLNDRNPSSMFVTLFIGLFDASTGIFTYANGGHIPPAVAGADGVRFFSTEDPDPLVGAWPGVKYKRREEYLGDGELCLLYTDGVTEAQDADGALFGQERLRRALEGASRDPEEAVEAVYSSTLEWRGDEPQSDDITMLAFRRKIPV